jgi:hypothetical protein
LALYLRNGFIRLFIYDLVDWTPAAMREKDSSSVVSAFLVLFFYYYG